jgi:hypothetical protein
MTIVATISTIIVMIVGDHRNDPLYHHDDLHDRSREDRSIGKTIAPVRRMIHRDHRDDPCRSW